jgi:hypothetical protein
VIKYDPAAAEQRAKRHVDHGDLAGIRLPVGATVGRAMPVLDARRKFNSWFVPLLAGETIVGFIQLERDLSLRRSSLFPRPVAASDWLQVDRVRERAESLGDSTLSAAEPYLSFDGSADRLAWRVEVKKPSGSRHVIFVAGDFVYSQAEPRGPEVE